MGVQRHWTAIEALSWRQIYRQRQALHDIYKNLISKISFCPTVALIKSLHVNNKPVGYTWTNTPRLVHGLSFSLTNAFCFVLPRPFKFLDLVEHYFIIIFHTVQDTFSVYCVPGSTPVPQNPMNAMVMVMVMVKLILNATSPIPSPLHPRPSPLTPFPHPTYRAAKAHSMRAWYPPPPPPLPMWHLLSC